MGWLTVVGAHDLVLEDSEHVHGECGEAVWDVVVVGLPGGVEYLLGPDDGLVADLGEVADLVHLVEHLPGEEGADGVGVAVVEDVLDVDHQRDAVVVHAYPALAVLRGVQQRALDVQLLTAAHRVLQLQLVRQRLRPSRGGTTPYSSQFTTLSRSVLFTV